VSLYVCFKAGIEQGGWEGRRMKFVNKEKASYPNGARCYAWRNLAKNREEKGSKVYGQERRVVAGQDGDWKEEKIMINRS
jgi:hypothetical protein